MIFIHILAQQKNSWLLFKNIMWTKKITKIENNIANKKIWVDYNKKAQFTS